MSGYEAGDDITLRVVVVPEDGVPTDGTTVATVVARCDDGTTVTPTAAPVDEDRAEWRALLVGAVAGEWEITWTVTGTGAGVQTDAFVVASLPVVPPGRSYATVAELTAYTGTDAPVGAARLLVRATRKVDQLCKTAVYPVDEDGMPTDAALRAVLRDATCAQVEWWGEIGDERGTGATAALAGAQIGTVRLPSGNAAAGDGSGSLEYAPDASTILAAAGLTTQGPIIPGPNGYGAIYPAGWP